MKKKDEGNVPDNKCNSKCDGSIQYIGYVNVDEGPSWPEHYTSCRIYECKDCNALFYQYHHYGEYPGMNEWDEYMPIDKDRWTNVRSQLVARKNLNK